MALPVRQGNAHLWGHETPSIKVRGFDVGIGWARGCAMTKPEREARKRVKADRAAIPGGLTACLAAMETAGHGTCDAARERK